ncbi:MAG: DUF4091 domain-containing protein [Clostridia bacterium]|nr:DUF4091 domain-containing protein [Clostridia bacterium]
MELLILNSLEKVFSDEKPNVSDIKVIPMLKNEKMSFQAAFCPETDGKITVLLGGSLAEISKAYVVKDIPVGNACFDDADDYYLRKTSGMYPDYLLPAEGEIFVEKGKWYSLWIEVSGNGIITGKNSVTVDIKGDMSAASEVEIEIIDAELPKQELVYTNWYHSDCICNYYGVEPFSDEYWRINKNFIKTAVEHGLNCILTPLFTPPLDTKVGGERKTVQLVKVRKRGGKYSFDFMNLRKWIAMCHECGVEYFEMSHLFTQWGAKHAPKIIATDRKGREKKIFGWFTRTSSKNYDIFLRQFSKELIKVIDAEGIREKCFFHVSDEPSKSHLKTYKRRAKLIEECFPDFRVIDALSDYAFYETGAVKNPIPAENDIEPFVGNVPELWTYYCCGQGKEYVPNRFVSMPSLRNRILGVLLYKYDIKGFLQWGYNFYNSQYSIKAINPYEVTDAGGSFPSGDSFMVYPADNGETLESLRLKVFYDAFQDLAALKALEKKIGRAKVIEILEKDLEKPLTFKEYPHDDNWLLSVREKVNNMIKEK